ncbi:MAG: D-alanyl-D-alanine carboxypeptidase [Defluviitaleaceae bacterium]|nr:D-alanyl-D-alanine carboxypeptidase [Defluviitaleaceae bacterium]
MKKIIKLCMFISIVFTFSANIYAATPKSPEVNAHGAILMDAETGRVLWGKNEHEPMAMASTTKIMTAILAIESGRINETVTVSSRAASAPKVKMNLSTGEKIRLGDLMLALMLESSNDAAVAIAEHLAGTVEEFCALMTQKAQELGADNTVFETPSGLDLGNHHSTAYDLAVITRYALTIPGFVALTNTSHASFSSDKRTYSMNNKNRLLTEYSGANGVKTGFTAKAGHCFVGAAHRGDMQLISVVLASGWGDKGRAQKWLDTKEVLDHGFDNFKFETIISEGAAGKLPVTRSRSQWVEYAYNDGVKIPLSREEKDNIDVMLYLPESIQAPINIGDNMGSAKVYIGDKLYCEVILVSTEAAARHDFKTSLEKVLNGYFRQMTHGPVEIILPEFER